MVELNSVAGNFAAPQPTCNKVGGSCNSLAHDHLDSPPLITATSIAAFPRALLIRGGGDAAREIRRVAGGEGDDDLR